MKFFENKSIDDNSRKSIVSQNKMLCIAVVLLFITNIVQSFNNFNFNKYYYDTKNEKLLLVPNLKKATEYLCFLDIRKNDLLILRSIGYEEKIMELQNKIGLIEKAINGGISSEKVLSNFVNEYNLLRNDLK